MTHKVKLLGKNVRVRGSWWHYQFEFKGQEFSGNTGFAGTEVNRASAEAHARRIRDQLRFPDQPADPKLKPFDVAAGAFVSWCRDVEYRAKARTAARIKGSIGSAVLLFADRAVGTLDAEALEAYKAFRVQQGCRDVTIRHDLHALSVFFQYAIRNKWASSNPVREIKVPSDNDALREHVITAEEESRYFAAGEVQYLKRLKSDPDALPNMADLARLMLEQGARPEELLSARQGHYDPVAGTLLIAGGKTKAARRVLELTAASRDILDRRCKLEGEWLFPSTRWPGGHLGQLNTTHARTCINAGVAFRIYDFRHTFATRMAQAGTDVATLAAILGHSSLRMIMRYVHPTQQHQGEAMKRYDAAQTRRRLKVVG